MKKSIENYNNNPLHGIAFVVLVWPSDLLLLLLLLVGGIPSVCDDGRYGSGQPFIVFRFFNHPLALVYPTSQLAVKRVGG